MRKAFLKSIAPVIVLLCLFQFTGCPGKTIRIFPSGKFVEEARSKREASLAELGRNRRLWQESRIDDYDFEIGFYTMVGGTDPGAAVKVRDGKNVSLEKISKDNPTKIYHPERIETIETVFDAIEDQIDDYQIVETRYNRKYGYPEKIRITSGYETDAVSFYEILKFEIVK